MKKLIALATVLALVVVLAVPVTAVNYAPDRPPWIYERQPDNTPSGDDTGWVDEMAEPQQRPSGIVSFLGNIFWGRYDMSLTGFLLLLQPSVEEVDTTTNDRSLYNTSGVRGSTSK